MSSRVDLIEITAYNHEDQLQGILVKFHTTLITSTTEEKENEEFAFGMEAWFKQNTNVEYGARNARTISYQNKLQVSL
jgi:hypothetical protein